MENLSGYTPTQLLKMINDSKVEHEKVKNEIYTLTQQVDEIEIEINAKIVALTTIEEQYVELIEELNNRENVIS